MSVTSITLNSLEIGFGNYSVDRSSIASLMSGPPMTPVMKDMAGRHPEYQRSQPGSKPISLQVQLHRPLLSERELDYASLVAAAAAGTLVPLAITVDAVTKTYTIHCSGPIPDEWLHKIQIEAVAPDPVPS